ncbi:hypothetical protein L9F63_001376, partial [Diploptera punctata]
MCSAAERTTLNRNDNEYPAARMYHYIAGNKSFEIYNIARFKSDVMDRNIRADLIGSRHLKAKGHLGPVPSSAKVLTYNGVLENHSEKQLFYLEDNGYVCESKYSNIVFIDLSNIIIFYDDIEERGITGPTEEEKDARILHSSYYQNLSNITGFQYKTGLASRSFTQHALNRHYTETSGLKFSHKIVDCRSGRRTSGWQSEMRTRRERCLTGRAQHHSCGNIWDSMWKFQQQ